MHLVPFPQPVQQLLRNIVVANDVIKSEEEQKRRNGTERDMVGSVSGQECVTVGVAGVE